MANLYDQVYEWNNLWEAYKSAAHGKRGRPGAAGFEYLLADNLLDLQDALREKCRCVARPACDAPFWQARRGRPAFLLTQRIMGVWRPAGDKSPAYKAAPDESGFSVGR